MSIANNVKIHWINGEFNRISIRISIWILCQSKKILIKHLVIFLDYLLWELLHKEKKENT